MYLSNTSILVDEDVITVCSILCDFRRLAYALQAMGVECVVAPVRSSTGFDADIVQQVLDRIILETNDG